MPLKMPSPSSEIPSALGGARNLLFVEFDEMQIPRCARNDNVLVVTKFAKLNGMNERGRWLVVFVAFLTIAPFLRADWRVLLLLYKTSLLKPRVL